MGAWRGWLLAAGVVVVSFVGVVLHGAEFFAADGNGSAPEPASVVRSEPVGVVPAAVLSPADDDERPAGRFGPGLVGPVAAPTTAPVVVGAVLWWFLVLPERRPGALGRRPAAWSGRAPPHLAVT